MIRAYQRAAQDIRAKLASAIKSGNLGTEAYLTGQLQAIERTLAQLSHKTKALQLATAQHPYLQAAHAVDLSLGPKAATGFTFTGSHRRTVEVLTRNLALKLQDAIQVVGRRTDDALRHVALAQTAVNVAAGGTRRELTSAIKERILRDGITDGITGFVDKGGARWSLDRYGEMVARTTTREAVSAGTANRMTETGQQLITISDHATSTPICQEYEGKTFALPGTTVEGYDTIDDLPPFHPNCQHVATPAEGNAERFLQALEADAPTPPVSQQTAVQKAVAPAAPVPLPPALSKGDKVHFTGGTNAIDGKPVKAGPATVVETKGDQVMLNLGTVKKPRWVATRTDQLEGLPARIAKPRTPGVGEIPVPRPFTQPVLKPTELRAHLGQTKATLDAPAKKAIKGYTGNDFYDLNIALRKGRTPDLARQIDRAFEQVTPTTKPAVLYRGITSVARLPGGKELRPGRILADKGFSSTTARRTVGEAFADNGGDLLELEIPPGARLIDVNRAVGSLNAHEAEILPPRNSRFVILEVIPAKGSRPRVIRARLLLDE
jgi:hypothetical protein